MNDSEMTADGGGGLGAIGISRCANADGHGARWFG